MSSSVRLIMQFLLPAVVLLALATPSFAADKKKQSDQAKNVLDKQADIAKALRDKLANSPDELQKQLDSLKADLAAEKDRHNTALTSLQKDLKEFTDAKDRKRTDRTQKSIDKENETFTAKSDDLNKKIADVQARLDAAKGQAK